MKKVFELDFHGRKLIVEHGELAKQADGSVLVRYNDTVILTASVVSKNVNLLSDFFPLTVNYQENKNLHSIYNLDKLNSLDSYEVYLDGASSFIEIFNDKSFTDKELIIFRDSFGSSISPLLIPYYNKITIIDNRYISSNYYLDKLNINDQDVLFLYSTLIVNNCFTLKN